VATSLTHGRALRYAGAPRAASYTTSGDTARDAVQTLETAVTDKDISRVSAHGGVNDGICCGNFMETANLGGRDRSFSIQIRHDVRIGSVGGALSCSKVLA